jgi:hypothetical protein
LFLLLILVSLAAALVTTFLVVLAFRGPISSILSRIVDDSVGAAWNRYLVFALLVVGVSAGVNTWNLERYLSGGEYATPASPVLELGTPALALEAYRAAIGSLRALAAALLLFFGIGLVVSAVQRALGERSAGTAARGARAGAGRPSDPSRGGRDPAARSGRERGGDPRRSSGRRRGPEGGGRPRQRPEDSRGGGSGNDRRGEERTGDARNGTEGGRPRPLSRFVDRHS